MIKAIAVDDEPLALDLVEMYCRKFDFLQFEKGFSNTAAALRFLEKNAVDLLFLDINMPAMNGWEFLDQFDKIESLFQRLPIIYILSSTVDPEDQRKALSYPIVKNFISKPLTKAHLMEIAEEIHIS